MIKMVEYVKDGYLIEEYSNGSIVKSLIGEEFVQLEQFPSIEEEVLLETRYQTMLLEMLNLGEI